MADGGQGTGRNGRGKQGADASPELRVLKEISNALPPLTDEERGSLEDLLLSEGCRDALVAWRPEGEDAEPPVVVDGHARYEICSGKNAEDRTLPFEVEMREVAGVADAREWRIKTQGGRRNLDTFAKAVLALDLLENETKAAEERRAKAGREHGRGRPQKVPQPVGGPKVSGEARELAAKAVGTSDETVRQVAKVKELSPTLYARLERREPGLSIKKAHKDALDGVKKAEREAARKSRMAAAEAILEAAMPENVRWVHGEEAKLLNEIPDGGVKLLLTDPPYGAGFVSNVRKEKHKPIPGDKSPKVAKGLLAEALEALEDKMADDSHAVIFCDPDLEALMRQTVENSKYLKPLLPTMIWDKKAYGLRREGDAFATSHEAMIYAVKGEPERGPIQGKTVYSYARVSTEDHPTPKPVALLRELIEATTVEGELVVDPFAGAGSTLVAAVETGRRAWGREKEDDYYEVGTVRIAEALKEAGVPVPAGSVFEAALDEDEDPVETVLERALRKPERNLSSPSPFRPPPGRARLARVALSWLVNKPRPTSVLVEPFAKDAIVSLLSSEEEDLPSGEFVRPAESAVFSENDPEVEGFWRTVLGAGGESAGSLLRRIEAFDVFSDANRKELAYPTQDGVERAFRLLLADRLAGVEGRILLRSALGEPIPDRVSRRDENLAPDTFAALGALSRALKGHRGAGAKPGPMTMHGRWLPDHLAWRIRHAVQLASRGRLTLIEGGWRKALSNRELVSDPGAAFYADVSRDEVDHAALFELLAGVEGDVLVTCDDSTYARSLARASGFETRPLPVCAAPAYPPEYAYAYPPGRRPREATLLVSNDLSWADEPAPELAEQLAVFAPPRPGDEEWVDLY